MKLFPDLSRIGADIQQKLAEPMAVIERLYISPNKRIEQVEELHKVFSPLLEVIVSEFICERGVYPNCTMERMKAMFVTEDVQVSREHDFDASGRGRRFFLIFLQDQIEVWAVKEEYNREYSTRTYDLYMSWDEYKRTVISGKHPTGWDLRAILPRFSLEDIIDGLKGHLEQRISSFVALSQQST